MEEKLEITNLNVKTQNKQILNNISLSLKKGELIAILGPNGAGKSTLTNIIMGNPKYKIESGQIKLNNENITNLSPEKKAKKGIFLAFQNPPEITGLPLSNFLRASYNSTKNKNLSVGEFHKLLDKKMQQLSIDPKFKFRETNHNFSGGEKKKSEILQLLLLEPKFAILDEIDSGLDINSIKIVAQTLNKIKKTTGIILITHQTKILHHIKPDKILILKSGQITQTGGIELANQIEKHGF